MKIAVFLLALVGGANAVLPDAGGILRFRKKKVKTHSKGCTGLSREDCCSEKIKRNFPCFWIKKVNKLDKKDEKDVCSATEAASYLAEGKHGDYYEMNICGPMKETHMDRTKPTRSPVVRERGCKKHSEDCKACQRAGCKFVTPEATNQMGVRGVASTTAGGACCVQKAASGDEVTPKGECPQKGLSTMDPLEPSMMPKSSISPVAVGCEQAKERLAALQQQIEELQRCPVVVDCNKFKKNCQDCFKNNCHFFTTEARPKTGVASVATDKTTTCVKSKFGAFGDIKTETAAQCPPIAGVPTIAGVAPLTPTTTTRDISFEQKSLDLPPIRPLGSLIATSDPVRP